MSEPPFSFPPESDLAVWTIEQGLTGSSLSELLQGFAERLLTIGIPLLRAYVAMPMISPELRAITHEWRRDTGSAVEQIRHDTYDGAFETSPFQPMVEEGLPFKRWRLWKEAPTGFALLDRLAAEGGTDYVAYLVSFDRTDTMALAGAAISFTSDAPSGFGDYDVARLDRLVQLLGLAACRFALSGLVGEILGAYLGQDAGRRVLRGEMRRGEGHRLRAALVFADLRGFTRVAETSGEGLVKRLGEHLAAMADPVEAAGGEVLKFLGDGLLAAFPVLDDEPNMACSSALAAAVEALAQNAAVNARHADAAVLDLDVALHLGEVFYGNVGAGSRLDYTVIGPAVNEASRIEALCSQLDQPLLMSADFAACCGRATRSIGRHRLRGVGEPREIFTLASP